MDKKSLIAAIAGVALSASIATAANAEQFHRTINLSQNMAGQIVIEDLGIGDTVTLTLINPTNQALTFTTTEQIGEEASFTVPANSQRTVSFDYNIPFDDDVEFLVYDPTGQQVATGVLVDLADEDLTGDGDVLRRTITLQPGMGEIVMEDLAVGDTVMLTLVNPTSQALTFQTTEQLGDEEMWVIPANSQRTVAFEYTRPFDDDVEYQVLQGGSVISRGVFLEGVPAAPTQGQSAIRGYW